MRCLLLALCICSRLAAGELEFARVGATPLLLDLHLPEKTPQPPPVVVYVHGGAWRTGDRKELPILGLLQHGFAVASVDYRLSPVAPFPAQIHDIKAAIRYLRANAVALHIQGKSIGIAGSSAGGHLAALVGYTQDHAELEGSVGGHRNTSSQVSAIVSFYGASNLQSILGQSTEFGLGVRIPALKLLLGDLPEKTPSLAKLASPVAHLDAKDPPALLFHGELDPQMPPAQSVELETACQAAGLSVELVKLPQAKHGGDAFYTPQQLLHVATFFKKHLLP
jgi:acetyl esterase/lipase